MALKAKLTTLDGLDDEVAKLYRKSDSGGYVLDVDEADGWALEDVRGIKSNRDDVLAKYKALKTKFADLDPEEARAAMKALKDLEAELEADDDDAEKPAPDAEKKPANDPRLTLLEQQVKQFREQLTEEKKAREEERARFIESRKSAVAVEALSAHTEDVGVLKPHLLSRLVQDQGENGEIIFRVRGDDGEPILVSNGETDPNKILKDYVGTQMRKEFPRNFPGNKASGGGMVSADVSSDADGKVHIKATDLDAITANIDKIGTGEVIVDD